MHTWGVWYVVLVWVPDRCFAWNICSKSTPQSTFRFMKLKVSILTEIIYTHCGRQDMITKILLVDISKISGLANGKHKLTGRSCMLSGVIKGWGVQSFCLRCACAVFWFWLTHTIPILATSVYSVDSCALPDLVHCSLCLFLMKCFFFLFFCVHKNVQPLTVSIQNSAGKFLERKICAMLRRFSLAPWCIKKAL